MLYHVAPDVLCCMLDKERHGILCHLDLVVPWCTYCTMLLQMYPNVLWWWWWLDLFYDVVILLWLYHDVLDALCCILYVNMPVVMTHVPQVVSWCSGCNVLHISWQDAFCDDLCSSGCIMMFLMQSITFMLYSYCYGCIMMFWMHYVAYRM